MKQIIHYFRVVYKNGVIPIIYRLGYRKLMREFPKAVGIFFGIGNRIMDKITFKAYKKVLHIETYDGSNQCVHPDVDVLPNKDYMALVCTPYPYNTEVYENPCLYILPRLMADYGGCVSQKRCAPIGNPIDKRHGTSLGEHMSDPAIIVYDDKIHIFYRDVELHSGVIQDILYEQVYSVNNLSLLSKKVVRRTSNIYVSPTYVVDCCGKMWEYSVHYIQNDSVLVCSYSEIGKSIWNEFENQTVVGKELDRFYVWHISVAYKDTRSKRCGREDKQDLIALFTMRNKSNRDEYILMTACYLNNAWKLQNKIEMPSVFRKKLYTPYKSCFVEGSNNIMISTYSKKKRWKIFTMEVGDNLFASRSAI